MNAAFQSPSGTCPHSGTNRVWFDQRIPLCSHTTSSLWGQEGWLRYIIWNGFIQIQRLTVCFVWVSRGDFSVFLHTDNPSLSEVRGMKRHVVPVRSIGGLTRCDQGGRNNVCNRYFSRFKPVGSASIITWCLSVLWCVCAWRMWSSLKVDANHKCVLQRTINHWWAICSTGRQRCARPHISRARTWRPLYIGVLSFVSLCNTCYVYRFFSKRKFLSRMLSIKDKEK